MLHYTDLESKVLCKPEGIMTDCLTIISGYVGIEPIRRLQDLPNGINATVIYGMYGCENISAPLHKALLELQQQLPNVEILYSTIPVHSKIYFWKNGTSITKALIGSANFSVSGLRNDYKEVLADVESEVFDDFQAYYDYVKDKCIPCTSNDVKVKKTVKVPKKAVDLQPFIAKGICRASFIDGKGKVPVKSGLNWCFSRAHVSSGDAYIPIKAEYIKLFPSLFPPKKYIGGIDNANSKGRKNRENDEIELIWDDGTVMTGLLEGQGVKRDGMLYPKQLGSSPKKAILGEYLRKRIGVTNDHIITISDLKRYGRTSVDISLIGEGIYYMDFSVNK